jgi:hypothetical protein
MSSLEYLRRVEGQLSDEDLEKDLVWQDIITCIAEK